MLITIFISLLAIFLAYLESLGIKNGLRISFSLLTVFIGISYGWANDYLSYLDDFQKWSLCGIGLFEFDKYSLLREGEYGWVFLNLLFKPFGFYVFFFVLTLFENGTLFYFINKYVPKQWYWFSVFFYTMQGTLMMTCTSMMRQWFAICLFMWAIEFLIKRRFLLFPLFIIASISVHASAIVLVPFLALFLIKPFQIKLWHMIVFFVLLIIWNFLGPKLLSNNLLFLLESEELSHYKYYSENIGENIVDYSLFGFIDIIVRSYLLPLTSLYYLTRNQETVFWGLLVSIICIMQPISSVLVITSRLTTYFLIFGVIAYPLALKQLQKKYYILFIVVLSIFVVTSLRAYFDFFNQESWSASFATYDTIFNHL